MKVAMYARTSSDDWFADLERQVGDMVDFVRARGWEMYHVYCDRAPSTDMEHRPGWGEMLRDASNGWFDVLLMRSIDRGFREVHEAAAVLENLRRMGVTLLWLRGASPANDAPQGATQGR